MGAPKIDIQIGGGNGFYTVTPVTKAGREWVDENVQSEGWQWLGNTLGVDDGRLARDIADGAQAAGLVVA